MSPQPGYRITDIWAWTAIGDDDEEGICGFLAPDGTMMPMIMADLVRLQELRPMAELIAKSSGRTLVLSRFTQRSEIDRIVP